MRHLYLNECNFTSSNCLEIYSLGKEYSKPLQADALKFIEQELITVDNVFSYLEFSLTENVETIKDKCFRYLSNNYTTVLNHESFLKIKLSTLNEILRLDNVDCQSKNETFIAAIKWAKANCVARGIPTDDANIRKILEDGLKLIQFPTMTAEEFEKFLSVQIGEVLASEI